MDKEVKQLVLDTIQSGFPIEDDPYGVLAGQLGCSRDDVKDAICALYADGSVRRIGASFDSRNLGYRATLCALAVPGGHDALAQVASVVGINPGVTHNYGRDNHYNLWFTLITRSDEQKAKVLESIRRLTECDDLLDLPASRKFKIAVDFGRQRAAKAGVAPVQQPAPASTSDAQARSFNADDPFDVEIVRWAQGDVVVDNEGALMDDPFGEGVRCLAETLDRSSLTREEVLGRLHELRATGAIRRFGAMVVHQRIGFSHNSMTVWNIPDDVVNQAGELFAQAPFVSHCYTRARAATWPYNLYAMTHAQSSEELYANIAALEGMLADSGVPCESHFPLETIAEYKKTSMRYFEEDQQMAALARLHGKCMHK